MVAYKPPMGWNSWNTFGGKINEKVVMESADILVESGLADTTYDIFYKWKSIKELSLEAGHRTANLCEAFG